jgi:hypothetical protein
MMDAEPLTWSDIWRHALSDCEAAAVLRVALDDAHPSVVAAAAEALAALVSAGDGLGPALDCLASEGEQTLSPKSYWKR